MARFPGKKLDRSTQAIESMGKCGPLRSGIRYGPGGVATNPPDDILDCSKKNDGMFMPDRYAAERGIPTTPTCLRSTISLRFDGKFLIMMNGKQTITYHAVSGRPNDKGTFNYSPQ